MLPEEQQQLRIDELTREMEAMRLQIMQLQEERERAQKLQGNAKDSPGAVGGSQKVVANINKWACNPLLGVAVNYALTTGKRIMEKPIIPKSHEIKNGLTSFLHILDAKLNGNPQNHPPVESTSPVKNCSAETQTYEVPCAIDKMVQQVKTAMKSEKDSNTVFFQQNQEKVRSALAYLEELKLTFKEKPEVYNRFLDLMKEFKAGNISVPDVIAEVKILFHGYPHFLVGFNAFLPPSHQINPQTFDAISVPPIASVHTNPKQVIEVVDEIVVIENHHVNKPLLITTEVPVKVESQSQKKPADWNQISSYMKKIQERFQNEPGKLKRFSTILQAFEKLFRDKACHDAGVSDKTEKELLQQIAELFRNNEDLTKEFTQYLGY